MPLRRPLPFAIPTLAEDLDLPTRPANRPDLSWIPRQRQEKEQREEKAPR